MLSDICVSGGYAHTRTTLNVLTTLNGTEETEVLIGLGHLQASMLFQSVALKAGVPAAWQEQPAAAEAASAVGEAKEGPALADGVSTALAATSSPRLAAAPFANRKLSDGEVSNAKTLRQLASLLTSALQPFFVGVIKLLSSRRGLDVGIRKQSHLVANTLASALLAPLAWLDSGDISLDYACATVAIGTVATFLTEGAAVPQSSCLLTDDCDRAEQQEGGQHVAAHPV